MDTNWKHQKTAITTDQKNRTEDEHLRELDKKHLEANNQKDELPSQTGKSAGENAGDGPGPGPNH
jgi:hypothetical protein